jgi:hypothetical protein
MTAQNVQQVPNVNDLNPPANYQAQFEKLWGVSS